MKGLYHTGATELKQIFFAPLTAVIDAEISLAKKIKGFIISSGFEGGKVKMINFEYTLIDKEIIEGEVRLHRQIHTLSVPVLTLLNLPLLSIKDAHFDMQVKMLTVLENHQKDLSPSLVLDNAIENRSENKVALKGYLTADRKGVVENRGLEANMKVKLHMGEASMPGGLIKLLGLMNNNLITENRIENKIDTDEE